MPKSNLSEEQRKANHREANKKYRQKIKQKLALLPDEVREELLKAKNQKKKEWYKENKDHVAAYNRQFKTKNPHYFFDKHLKNEYGITKEHYDAMAEEQDYKCYVCGVHSSSTQRGKLFVDHNHKTGKIRALLCQQCNTALGMAKEDPAILASLISYLQEFS